MSVANLWAHLIQRIKPVMFMGTKPTLSLPWYLVFTAIDWIRVSQHAKNPILAVNIQVKHNRVSGLVHVPFDG